MPVDIVPELFSKIESDFYELVRSDKTIQKIYSMAKNGTATHTQTQQLTDLLGQHVSTALKKHMVDGVLPNNTLYYNIANRTVTPIVQQAHITSNSIAKMIQLMLNQKAGIGLNAIGSILDLDRLNALINSLTVAENIDEIQRILDEPLINMVSNFANEFVKANAEFAYESGLEAKIVRTLKGGACDWCVNLAGSYDYPNVPDDIYRRHDYCRCETTYTPAKGKRQDVWSKAKFW